MTLDRKTENAFGARDGALVFYALSVLIGALSKMNECDGRDRCTPKDEEKKTEEPEIIQRCEMKKLKTLCEIFLKRA